jgi:hypothetical protein
LSRETDTPSSGPNGHSGAAYPSGTPPYGTPTASDAGADAGRSAAQPEDRKTETTLTTRIRINIPGSRPIPPVVVRTPVADTESSDESPRTDPPAPAATQAMGTVEPPAEPAQPAEEKTSDWFAPRKSAAPKGGQGGGAANGAGTPGGSPATGTPGVGAGAPGPGAAPGAPRPAGGRPGGVVGSMSVPGGSRPGGASGAGTRPGQTNGSGLPGATGGPVAPGHGGGTGSFDVTEALGAGPLGNGPRSDGGEPRRDELPYFSDSDTGTQNTPNGQGGYGAPVGVSDFNAPGGQGPAGPTSGPVTGEGPLAPPRGTGGPGGPAGPGGPGGMGGPHGAGLGPGGGLSDDTAILTPQKPAPEPGAQGGYPAPDNISGHTVTSGIPVVPPGANSPFGPGGTGEAPVPHTPPRLPEPVAQNVPSSSSSKKKQKKGSNKLVLVGTAVVVVAGLAYGAGLLMNHSDVPKGTTVLGVDIGGGTRDDAVKKLDEAFGGNVNKPLKLSVGGKTVSLKPDQAGLQLDEQATVGAAAQSDYNPVSVIGSLFGNHRVVDPVMPVDEEKLAAALKATSTSGGSGSMTEGTIQFKSGKAVAVYGKAGKGIDVAKSTEAVEEAYRTQVETGSAPAVAVPTTTQKPSVSDAEVDRMMNEFAKPAMSGIVTIEAGGVQVKFSPQNSLWKFLGVRAVGGKLVEHYDTTALKNLYGGAWDGVLITRGNGKKTPVTPQDVISAMRKPLLGKTPAERVGVIETNAG